LDPDLAGVAVLTARLVVGLAFGRLATFIYRGDERRAARSTRQAIFFLCSRSARYPGRLRFGQDSGALLNGGASAVLDRKVQSAGCSRRAEKRIQRLVERPP
jgi:hypothetical protein